jgi:hypothetical protein
MNSGKDAKPNGIAATWWSVKDEPRQGVEIVSVAEISQTVGQTMG